VAPGIADSGNKYDPSIESRDCNTSGEDPQKVGEITFDGATKLWPPNHKMQPVTITATAEDPDDEVTLTTNVSHDEEGLNGAGNPALLDADPPMASDGPNEGSAQTGHDLRAERSGRGDGRSYIVHASATFTDADMDDGYGMVTCEEDFEVFVPHDMRNRGGGPWSAVQG